MDVMEVGFRSLRRVISNPCRPLPGPSKIAACGLARCVEKDIDAAYESLRVADAFRIHTFIATSPMHIATKLRSTLPEVIERAVHMIKRARNYTDDVEFSCEDGGRTPIDDLCRMVEAAINAGATTINIPDRGYPAG